MEYLVKDADRRIPYVVERVDEAVALVLLVHGIFSEKNEDGRFSRLASMLADEHMTSVRFDYAGHGEHSVDSHAFTIASALSDVVHVARLTQELAPQLPLHVIASSFGGSLALLYLRLDEAIRPSKLVLLNPVTDYRATFLQPRGPQMQERFTATRLDTARRTGVAEFGDDFALGLPLLIEFELYRPYETFDSLDVPTLVVHGDRDTAVPYDVTRLHAMGSPAVRFETIAGADHAFVEPKHEAESFSLIREHLGS